MFDEQTAAAIINPSVSAAAAALTIAMLNSNAGAGGTNVSTGSVPAVMPQLSLQLNQSQQQLTQLLTGKDSRWLQLEICREYQRGQCVRSEQDCKYAHPPSNVEIQNGRVTACFDSIKGRCSRENPKCKYLHPPQHLKDQLLANGKQNLVMKNLLSQQYSNQMPAMPALAQITQQQYSNPLALQSTLSLPYFIPSLYPGQANLLSPVPDPFSAAFQGTVCHLKIFYYLSYLILIEICTYVFFRGLILPRKPETLKNFPLLVTFFCLLIYFRRKI
ncbi:unnamed protein product [Meloidogyne enterolobii]|uniref:Muscleblind-like protein n=2 Tax=Meloidogyne enterolobii TaxID=390850 RepID=A0A6V7XQ69_MELEN|nr:unnamed protein product [Meloidogyne enterolobii]